MRLKDGKKRVPFFMVMAKYWKISWGPMDYVISYFILMGTLNENLTKVYW